MPHKAPAPAVPNVSQASVVDFFAPAPAAPTVAQAPVGENIALAPPVSRAAQGPVVNSSAPAPAVHVVWHEEKYDHFFKEFAIPVPQIMTQMERIVEVPRVSVVEWPCAVPQVMVQEVVREVPKMYTRR